MKNTIFAVICLLCASISYNAFATQRVYSKAYDGYINIREEATNKSPVIGKFYNGPEGAELLSDDGVWSCVNCDGIVGYVNSSYLQKKPTIKYTGEVDADWISGIWCGRGGFGLIIFNNGTWYYSYEAQGISGRYIMQNNEVVFKTLFNPYDLSEFDEALQINTKDDMLGDFSRAEFMTAEEEGFDWPYMTKERYMSIRASVLKELSNIDSEDVEWVVGNTSNSNNGNILEEEDTNESLIDKPIIKYGLWVMLGIIGLALIFVVIKLVKKAIEKSKIAAAKIKTVAEKKSVEMKEAVQKIASASSEKVKQMSSNIKDSVPSRKPHDGGADDNIRTSSNFLSKAKTIANLSATKASSIANKIKSSAAENKENSRKVLTVHACITAPNEKEVKLHSVRVNYGNGLIKQEMKMVLTNKSLQFYNVNAIPFKKAKDETPEINIALRDITELSRVNLMGGVGNTQYSVKALEQEYSFVILKDPAKFAWLFSSITDSEGNIFNIDLLPDEKMLCATNCNIKKGVLTTHGTIYLTNQRLAFAKIPSLSSMGGKKSTSMLEGSDVVFNIERSSTLSILEKLGKLTCEYIVNANGEEYILTFDSVVPDAFVHFVPNAVGNKEIIKRQRKAKTAAKVVGAVGAIVAGGLLGGDGGDMDNDFEFDSDGDGINDSIGIDTDGDGMIDSIEMDTDGDGIADTVMSDTDGDGVFDTMGMDTDGNGVIDTVGMDTDGDGHFDSIAKDTDGDGMFDTLGQDTNGDGQIDSWAMDTNGDGSLDAIGRDIDGDGRTDLIGRDTDGDGRIDAWGQDTNGDGVYDTFGMDTNGDGITDVVGKDINGDGNIDVWGSR